MRLAMNRIGPRVRAAFLALALTVFGAQVAPVAAQAQGGPAEVAAGAAVAGVVIKVIGGLATWINDQTDDCSAAATGAAWGNDCNLIQKDEQDTGYYSAWAKAEADNGCAHGYGHALAQEGALGSWSRCDVKPFAIAWAKPLHKCQDEHYGRGWAKARVDGKMRADTNGTPGSSAPGARIVPAAVIGPVDPYPVYPDGTVLAVLTIDSLSVTVPKNSYFAPSWSADLVVDGQSLFQAAVSVDGSGNIFANGDLPASAYTVQYDGRSKTYGLTMPKLTLEFPIDTLGVAGGAPLRGIQSVQTTQTTQDYSVSLESEVNGEDAKEDGGGGCTGEIEPVYIDRVSIMERDIALGIRSPQILLGPAFPNPVRMQAAIPFALGQDMPVKLQVFDVAGRLTRTLRDGLESAGSHEISWDGRNAAGQRVSPGVYYYVLRAGDLSESRRVVVVP